MEGVESNRAFKKIVASGYIYIKKKKKEKGKTRFWIPQRIFLSLLFYLSFSGHVRVFWLLENLGEFEKENLGLFVVKTEAYRVIFYTRRMLGIHLC